MVAVKAFLPPLALLRFPRNATTIPPLHWEESPLRDTSVAVALTIGRLPEDGLTPSFTKVGEYPTLAALRAQARSGVVRVAVEIDLVQRPHKGKVTVQAFGRRALRDLLAVASTDSAALPSLPLQGIVRQADMLRGFADLPAAVAPLVVCASGRVRGIFARPWYSTSESFPWPHGFSQSSHSIVWATVALFSDLIYLALQQDKAPFDGLVCPRSPGKVGIRLRAGEASIDRRSA